MGDAGRPIHCVGSPLSLPMEMDSGSFIAQLIDNIDNNGITEIGFNGWEREFVVNTCIKLVTMDHQEGRVGQTNYWSS